MRNTPTPQAAPSDEQIRDQTLEEAAEAAELEATGDLRDTHYDRATRLCAAAIRALK
jgi:hypothetical protein